MGEANCCHVQLDGLEADLISKVGSEEMQSAHRGWEALPPSGGAKGGVAANTS